MRSLHLGTDVNPPRNQWEPRNRVSAQGVRYATIADEPGRLRADLTCLSAAPVELRQDQICYRAVQSRSDLLGAFGLLQERYESAGLAEPASNCVDERRIRMMPFHGWRQSQVFIAALGDRIVGTVTLICDGRYNLPIAQHYRDEIKAARKMGRVGEITSLAVDPVHPKPAEIFGQLTRLLTFFARVQRMDFLAATVHPRHAKFYCNAMGFQLIGEEVQCHHVAGNPGVAVLGSVNDESKYRKRWRDYYFSGSFGETDLQARPMAVNEFRECQAMTEQALLDTGSITRSEVA
ncbi:N-acyl amino acid synthase FeeM domain-containing protein [Allorhodopirellula solitaria]|uniref:N-acyl amino acid synthase FeeM catalytic core domain-containing protein n=1 Tax=Allorhodopirellula solitaria TaxID=2527987 RepID=A0A5C5X088_9BACT|nr:hypothetical protein [Allorhodopirellula solitaria]TWT56268.1 hypothetical protein CA85_44500 [Allorhodopirellula solitaria]